MRFVDKRVVVLALAVISQMSCGGRTLGGGNNDVGSADGDVGSDGCTVGCAGEPETLADELDTPVHIAIDSTHVYWSVSSSGKVKKAPLAGGTTTLLYDGEHRAESIVLDSTHVYWTSRHGMLMKIPKAGGTAIEVASGYGQFENPVVLDTTHVYWIQNVTSDSDKLLRAPLDGGVSAVVVDVPDSVTGLAIDAIYAYLVLRYSGTIVKVPLDGGATEEIVSGEVNPGSLAVDSSRAYWFGENRSVVKSAPLSGGVPTVLAESALVRIGGSSNGTLGDLVIDATHLYWISNGVGPDGPGLFGTVSKVPLDVGSPTVVVAIMDGSARDLAVDSTHVYWTTSYEVGGAVMRVPK